MTRVWWESLYRSRAEGFVDVPPSAKELRSGDAKTEHEGPSLCLLGAIICFAVAFVCGVALYEMR